MCEVLLTVVLMILPSKPSLKRSIPSSKRQVYMYGFKPRRSRLSKLNRQIGKHVTFTLLRVNSSYTNHITLTKALFFKRVQLKQRFSNSCKSSPKLQFRIVALYNKHMATHGIFRAETVLKHLSSTALPGFHHWTQNSKQFLFFFRRYL